MKIYKFKKIIGKFFGYEGESLKMKEINPERDWSIILTLFVFGTIFIAVFSFYMYGKVNGRKFFVNSVLEETLVETIDRDELKNIIKYYESKDRLFQGIKSQKQSLVDPSV